MPKLTNKEIRSKVTETILAALERGVSPWRRPWHSGGGDHRPHNAASGHIYRGVNVPYLAAVAMLNDYPSQQWLTFRQAKELGGSVRKGEKASWVVFAKPIRVRADHDDPQADEEGKKQLFMLRVTPVFNVAQCDDLALPKREQPAELEDGVSDSETARDTLVFARQAGARVRLCGDRAYYHRLTDEITLPEPERFLSADGFAATLLHELTHWTGAESRLDRTKGKLFGDPDYAFEELVAELGSAMLCQGRGIGSEHVESHAAYIESWQRALRSDESAIFQAAKLAEQAVDYLMPETVEQIEAVAA